MNEEINKQFEDFQKELEIREKKLKDIVKFEPDDRLDMIIDELKNKTDIL